MFCHREAHGPEEPYIVEQVPVRVCRRRGVTIDLMLERAREPLAVRLYHHARRAGGELPAVAAHDGQGTSRIRVPTRRASRLDELHILIDTRERYPYRFPKKEATIERQTLPAGDYGVRVADELVAVVERKSLQDLTSNLVSGSLTYALAGLATVERAALVVEDRYAAIFKLDFVPPGFAADLLAAVQVPYPKVPIIFCDTRPLAEEWVHRFLGAAVAFGQAELESNKE